MADPSARPAGAGLAIALGLVAASTLTAESSPPPAALATSEIAAALAFQSFAASADARSGAPQVVHLDDAAANAVCRGGARAALLGRALTIAESSVCRAEGRRVREEPVAFVAAAIAVPIENHFVDALSLEQLRRVFGRSRGERLTFRDLDARWPSLEVVALGVGAPRGAHAALRRALGEGASIAFAERSSDAEVATAIEATPGAIGFFGATQPGVLSHALRLVPIRDRERGPTYPTRDALEADAYPLGATIWLLTDAAATSGSSGAPGLRKEAITTVAGTADCLAFVERRSRDRLAAR